MRLFPWDPGSGGSIDAADRLDRWDEIQKTILHLDLTNEQKAGLARRAAWLYLHARPEQVPPQGAWEIWFLLGGRGSGKTRTGAETIAAWALNIPDSYWALVAPTLKGSREVMIEGESGLLSILPPSALWGGTRDSAYNSGRPQLRLANGAILRGFSSETPDGLRGPQFHGWWGDEPASWRDAHIAPEDPAHLNTTFSNLLFSTRLPAEGWQNRGIMTGTPAAVGLLAGRGPLPGLLTGYEGVSVQRMRSIDNVANLNPFYRRLIHRMAGTRLGRQELDAELLTDVEGALVRGSWILVADPPPLDQFMRIGVGVDPAGAHRSSTSDETGIVVGGLDGVGRGWVLADLSGRWSPAQWRDIVARAVQQYQADFVVAERNFGGDLVEENLRNLTSPVRVEMVHASRGKALRAEPISALYEVRMDPTGQHPIEEPGVRIRHADHFPELVDQWTTWVPSRPGKISPDRLDAQVHLFHGLLDAGSGAWEGSDLLANLGTY